MGEVGKRNPITAKELAVVKLMHKNGATMLEIQKRLQTHHRRLVRMLELAGLPLRPVGSLTPEGRAAIAAASRGRRGEKRSDETRAKVGAAKLAQGEKTARGIKPHDGYLVYTRGPNRDRGVHRVLMENKLGRKLERGEHVHHVDHARANNSDSNLRIMTASEHTALHNKERSHG